MTSAPVGKDSITFAEELARKATHMGALIIPGGYYFLGLEKSTMLYIMVPVTVAMIFIDIARLRNWKFWTGFARHVIGRIIRRHEMAGDFTGATYILLSVCFTVALYSTPIAIAALAFIIVGDSFAAVIGRKFGRHKFRTKSYEGSFACLVGTVIVACLAPGLPLTVGLIGAATATLVEAVSFYIDDNISVPLVSGLVMTIVTKISAFA